MDIKCRKLSCKYNDNYVCKSPKVNIDNHTVCDSFEYCDCDKKIFDNTKTLFLATPKCENYRHIKDVELKCNAKCFFNCKGECMSNGITVICPQDISICGTFLKK